MAMVIATAMSEDAERVRNILKKKENPGRTVYKDQSGNKKTQMRRAILSDTESKWNIKSWNRMTIKQEQSKAKQSRFFLPLLYLYLCLFAWIECQNEQKDWMTGVKYARQINQCTYICGAPNANATDTRTSMHVRYCILVENGTMLKMRTRASDRVYSPVLPSFCGDNRPMARKSEQTEQNKTNQERDTLR